MIIALVGPSGSGKSTIINYLQKCELLKTRNVVIRKEDDFFIIKLLKLILGDKPFSDYKQEKFFDKKSQSLKSKIFSQGVYWFYPLAIYCEFIWIYILYSIIWKNRILLSDRYIYDYLITFEEMLGIRSYFVRLLITHFPKPYLSFYLKISKKTSLSRNKDNIEGKITSRSNLHDNVLRGYNGIVSKLRIMVISSEQALLDTQNEIGYYIHAKEKLSKIKSLSISGIDGSGKSTICKNLGSLCEQLGISFHTINLYHRPILYKLLSNLEVKYNKSTSGLKIQSKRSFFWALSTFIDSYIQFLFVRIINLNSLVIFDRYFYDYLVSFEYRKVVHFEVFKNLIPKVNRSFVLTIKPEKAYSRATDGLAKKYFQDLHDLYTKITDEQDLILIHVDDKSPKEVLGEILKFV